MQQAPGGWVKVRLTDPDGNVETPWAEKVAPGRFRIDNLPFIAYGVSCDDIVEARATEHEDVFEFVRVVHPSGNRTIRIAFLEVPSSAPEGERIRDRLTALGCGYEGMNPKLLVVNVPPEANLDAVADYLTTTGLNWEYANPAS